jgi:ABC-type glycerol-3-phosphate transport system substrate-binding protein
MKVSAVLVAVLLVSAACGPAATPEVVEREVTREVEVETEVEKVITATPGPSKCDLAAPGDKTRINMIGWTYPIVDFYAEELEGCNEVENLTVNTQMLDSGSAHDQIRLALSSGDTSPYDIVMNDDSFLVEVVDAGWLMPLDDLVEKYRDEYNLDDIPEGIWETARVGGKIYGIPIESNTMHIFYRPDLLEKHGLEVPETYDDVIAACGVLKEDDTIDLPFTINLHAGWAWYIEFHNFLGSYGGDWLNADGSPAFNGPEGVQAVEKMLEVVDACMGEEGMTYSIDDSEIGMETGTLAMVNIWASRAANMDDPEKSQYVGQIEFAPAPRTMPDGPHAGPAAVTYYSIPANPKVDPDLIFRVIMEAVDAESQLAAAELGIPVRESVLEDAEARYLAPALETISNGAGIYSTHPAIGIAKTAIANWLPKVMTGMGVQEALDAAAEEYVSEATAQGYLE